MFGSTCSAQHARLNLGTVSLKVESVNDKKRESVADPGSEGEKNEKVIRLGAKEWII